MPKSTPEQLIERGFQADQFGAPPDWSDLPDGYLARVIGDAGLWVRHEVGAGVYDGADAGGYLHLCLRNAELCHASAELWRRRKAFLDSAATLGNQDGEVANRREMRDHARGASACADYWVAEAQRVSGQVPDIAGTGSAFGHIETGQFPPVSARRLN